MKDLRHKFTGLTSRPHGTNARYMGGCRCLPCRASSANYRLECLRRQRLGISDPLVPAAPVVEHLRNLSQKGIGYRAVAESAGVWQATLQRIKNGENQFIKRSSARRILAVDEHCARDHSNIDATYTWQMVNALRREGFTYRVLAARTGVSVTVLSHRGARVTAKTQMKIEKFYNMINAEAAA